jgi:hypothetical protein
VSETNPYRALVQAEPEPDAPETNPYRALVRQEIASESERLRGSLSRAGALAPDREAEVLDLSARIGLAPDTVDANLETVRAEWRRVKHDPVRLREDSPTLARWLEDPENAAVAQDDLASLANLEWLLRTPTRMLQAGIAQTEYGARTSLQMFDPEGKIRDRIGRAISRISPYAGVAAGVGMSRLDLDERANATRVRALEPQLGVESGAQSFFGTAYAESFRMLPQIASSVVASLAGGTIGAALAGGGGAAVPAPEEVVTVPTLATLGALGGPAVNAFVQEAGPAYRELRDTRDENGIPIDDGTARAAAVMVGSVNAVLEVVGFRFLSRVLPGGRAISRRLAVSEAKRLLGVKTFRESLKRRVGDVAKADLAETLTEIGQEITPIMAGLIAKEASGREFSPEDWEDRLAQVVEVAYRTAAGTLPLAGAGGGAGVASDMRRARKAEAVGKQMTKVGEVVAASKLAARMPEKVADLTTLMQESGAPKTVYIPVEQFKTYFQGKDADPATVADALGISQEFTEAAATGGDLAIPMPVYVARIAGTEHHAALLPDLKYDPADMTPREAEAFRGKAAESLETEAAAIREQASEVDTADLISETVAAKLTAAGVAPAVATHQARLYGAFFTSLGERTDQDPLELFNAYELTVTRGDAPAAAPATRPVAAATPAPVAAAAPLAAAPAATAPTRGKRPRPRGKGAAAVPMHASDLRSPSDIQAWIKSNGGIKATKFSDITPGSQRAKALRWLLKGKTGRPVSFYEEQLVEAGFFEDSKEAADWLEQALSNPTGIEIPTRMGRELTTREMAEGFEQHERRQVERLSAQAESKYGIDQERARALLEEALRSGETIEEVEAFDLEPGEIVEFQGDIYKVTYPEEGEPPTLEDGVDRKLGYEQTVAVVRLGKGTERDVLLEQKRRQREGTPENQGALPGFEDVAEQRKGVERQVAREAAIPFADMPLFGERTEEGVKAEQDARDRREFGKKQDTLFQRDQSLEPPRGLIRFQKGGRAFDVRLLDDADRSTFLHETAHFFLEVYGDVAYSGKAPEQIAADYETLLTWFGVKSRDNITTEHHERFASTFEEYLKTGKAPSAELRGVFARFAVWLRAIYGRAKAVMGSALTPEVRAVFDRMLATDEQIAAAEAEQAYDPLFPTAKDAGVSEAEYARYQMLGSKATEAAGAAFLTELLKAERTASSEWYKTAKAAVQREVEAEIAQDPVFRAVHLLRTGRMLDGSEVPEALAGLKLATQGLVDRKGREFLAVVPFMHHPTGEDPDVVAELLGFRSGDELLSKIERAVRPGLEALPAEGRSLTGFGKRFVAALVQARMAERYGPLLTSEVAAPDAAMAAVHTSVRADALFEELTFLARKIGTVPTMDKTEIQRTAERIVDGLKVGGLNPHRFRASEVAQARAAGKFHVKGDLPAAYIAKQRQLLSFYAYREAVKAQKDRDRSGRLFRQMTRPPSQKRLGRAQIGAREQMNALLLRFGVPTPDAPFAPPLAQWAEERIDAGQDVDIAAWLLDDRRTAPIDSLTVAELRDVRDAVKAISHLASDANRVLEDGRRVAFSLAKGELIAAAEANLADLGPVRADRQARGVAERAADAGEEIFSELIRIETLVRSLDGYKIDGPWHRYLLDRFNDAKVEEADLHADITRKLADLLDEMPDEVRDRLRDKVYLEGIGQDGESVTRMYLLNVALNMGNAENRRRLLEGNGFSEAALEEVAARLTEAEWDLVQGVWDTIETLWPRIAALHERRTGVPLKKVEAVPVQTSHGTFRGGYYPIVYDRRGAAMPGEQQAVDRLGQLFEGQSVRAYTARSHTKERVAQVKAPLLLDSLSVLPNHIRQVIHDVAFREVVISIGRLIMDPEIRDTLARRLGVEKRDQLMPWLRGIANYEALGVPEGMKGLDRWAERLRTNTSAAVLAFRIGTAVQNFTNLPVALATVGPKWLARGLQAQMSNPVETWRFVHRKSGDFRHRAELFDRDARERMQSIAGDEGWTATGTRWGFAMIAATDMATAVPTWLGAYRKALDAGMDEKLAVRAGDEAIRRTMGSAHPGDLPLFLRKRGATRFLTMFYSYMNTQLNLYVDFVGQARHAKRMGELGPRRAAELLGSAMGVWVANALLADLLVARGPEDEEDGWLEWAVRRTLLWPAQLFPFGGALARSFEDAVLKGKGLFGIRLTPIEGTLEKGARAVRDAAKWAKGDGDGPKAALGVTEAVALGLGVPGTTQVGYLIRALGSEESKESPQRFARDAAFGQRR